VRQTGHHDLAGHDVRLQHVSGKRAVFADGTGGNQTANSKVTTSSQRGAVGRQQRERSRVKGQLVRDEDELFRVCFGLRRVIRGHDKEDGDGGGYD